MLPLPTAAPSCARLRAPVLALTLALVAGSCGSLPPGVVRAQRLLDAHDYTGADAAADAELARRPAMPELWRIKVQAALGRRDNAGAVQSYRTYRERQSDDDPRLLRAMARITLWQAVHSPSPVLATRAIQVIERLEIEELAQDVADKISDDNDAVAAAAAVALLRSLPNAPYVITELLSSDDPKARAIAVEGIGRKIKAAARDDLLPMLADSDPGVRSAAVAAISAMKKPDDTERLRQMAVADPDQTVRAQALRGLALGDREGLLEAGRTALGDTYLGARLAGLALLEKCGAEAVPLLTEQAHGADLFVALRAAVALNKLGTRLLDPLDRGLEDPAWTVRAAATNAITELCSETEARSRIELRLRDDQAGVRLAAARALYGFDPARATTELAAALDEPDPDTRLRAATELGQIGDARALPVLTELARSADPAMRGAAIRGHVTIGTLGPALVDALADDAMKLRIDAAAALIELLKK